jgi:hypothetical protein
MKNKDTVLLENAYDQVRSNETSVFVVDKKQNNDYLESGKDDYEYDSKPWILYKSSDVQDAVDWISKNIEIPQSVEIETEEGVYTAVNRNGNVSWMLTDN